jgi:signal transduction histidine kinase
LNVEDDLADFIFETDKERLIGCIINIISNSIKFTDCHGEIEISLEKTLKSIN